MTGRDKRYCNCFGDSGLHASTHVPKESDELHCDLCGWPVAPGSEDVLTARAQHGDETT